MSFGSAKRGENVGVNRGYVGELSYTNRSTNHPGVCV